MAEIQMRLASHAACELVRHRRLEIVTMDGKKKGNEGQGRKNDATDDRTLDDIEEQQKLPADQSHSPSPSPDEGGGRASDDDAGEPM